MASRFSHRSWQVLCASVLLLVGRAAYAGTVMLQDNFDSNTPVQAPTGWVAQASGGNGQGRALTENADYFDSGQYAGHDVYAAEAFINVPGAGPESSGTVTLDRSLGASAVAGTVYDLSVDVGLRQTSTGTEAPNVNYGIQLWAGTPNLGGSTLLSQIAPSSSFQVASAPAAGDWTTWTGSYPAIGAIPIDRLWVRLFSIDSGGGSLSDYVAWDNVSVSATTLLIGDANGDDKVNFNDLLTLAQNYGRTGATWSQGDFDGDGSVGFSDLLLLAQHYGESDQTTSAAAVPEPLALNLLPLLIALVRGRKCY